MKLEKLAEVSASVAGTSGRLEKIARLAALLREVPADEIPIAIGFLTGWPRQGKIGVGWSSVAAARDTEPATTSTLELREIDRIFDQLQLTKGKNSAAERARLLADLFSRATSTEQQFLSGLLVGEVRQGALEGVLTEAVAKAASLPSDKVRRAAMMAGDLGVVAESAMRTGGAGISQYDLQLFRPVQPMLADSAPTVADAFVEGDTVAVEWKLDGARIQVHRSGERVEVYTRGLLEVTDAVPEVVDAVRALPERDLILDGEVIALSPDGRPRSFQTTMQRFGRRLNVLKLRDELPLTVFIFDLLYHGESIVDEPLASRLDKLNALVPESMRVLRIVTSRIDEAQQFQSDAIARGHEGVMVKTLSAPYAAGKRGSAWIKVKEARTLDLVVLAVEWGSGRRKGWLSNLHLGARDPRTGDFVMLGKTFKGMTDEMLKWQTEELLKREVRREGHIVYVRPELVVEIAFNEVQTSSHYPGGVALRFARVKGYRPDKKASEADTIDTVRAFLVD
jgi:DNA ligase-1